MQEPIVNKVAQSGMITLDPEEYLKHKIFVPFQIEPFLSDGILKEKIFRSRLAEHSPEPYRDKYVYIMEPDDTLIPLWTYMLISSFLNSHARMVFRGNLHDFKEWIVINEFIREFQTGKFRDQRVVLKGCGKEKLSPQVYTQLSFYLVKEVRSLMFGEPCSTVPVYKRK